MWFLFIDQAYKKIFYNRSNSATIACSVYLFNTITPHYKRTIKFKVYHKLSKVLYYYSSVNPKLYCKLCEVYNIFSLTIQLLSITIRWAILILDKYFRCFYHFVIILAWTSIVRRPVSLIPTLSFIFMGFQTSAPTLLSKLIVFVLQILPLPVVTHKVCP